MEVILTKARFVSNPKSDVLVTSRVLGIWFKLRDLTSPELSKEARILAPEKAYVIDFKQLHGPTFQSETKGPTTLLGYISVCIFHDSIEDHTAAQDF